MDESITPHMATDIFAPDEIISVIIATHQGLTRIRNVLSDLADQTLPHNLIRVLVVENGVKDGTSEVVNEYAERHPNLDISYYFDPKANAGNARNLALDNVESGYVTFVDDDDRLEKNYLLAMWLSASPESVAVGPMCDVDPTGKINIDTANNRRISSFGQRRVSLSRHAGILGLNAAKLIPAQIIKNLRYDPDLSSGEDVLFMAGLLTNPILMAAPAADLPYNMYQRELRGSSISRPTELTYNFAVEQRLQVISGIERLKVACPPSATSALKMIQRSQSSFISRYLIAHPDSWDAIEHSATEVGMLAVLRTLLAELE